MLADRVAAAAAAALGEAWETFDSEALLAELGQLGDVGDRDERSDVATLRRAFLALGLDLPERAAEDEDEGEAAATAEGEEGELPKARLLPPTDRAGALLAAVAPLLTSRGQPPTLPKMLAALQVARTQWGEPALRFALRCAQAAAAGAGVGAALAAAACVNESTAWAALEWSSPVPVDAVLRANLRRAWRSCAQVEAVITTPAPAPVKAEAGEAAEVIEEPDDEVRENDQDGEVTETPPPPIKGCVEVEALVNAVLGDPLLARVWAREAVE